ncbi:hypothetical protein DFH07DRAFT_772817 [Mycena maculata]|uniref:Uncharacterized protein n=1 Tax=Mycena maculata TaxID=230809 RepID=A0AAD7J6F1_9AGAR|nr:hypothetical protein DFH07DRAFT_772817 [Mycena maculata]
MGRGIRGTGGQDSTGAGVRICGRLDGGSAGERVCWRETPAFGVPRTGIFFGKERRLCVMCGVIDGAVGQVEGVGRGSLDVHAERRGARGGRPPQIQTPHPHPNPLRLKRVLTSLPSNRIAVDPISASGIDAMSDRRIEYPCTGPSTLKDWTQRELQPLSTLSASLPASGPVGTGLGRTDRADARGLHIASSRQANGTLEEPITGRRPSAQAGIILWPDAI